MSRPKKTVAKRTRESIAKQYGRGVGLVALAEKYELSVPVIRRVLTEDKVSIRGRGRPATLQT